MKGAIIATSTPMKVNELNNLSNLDIKVDLFILETVFCFILLMIFSELFCC